MLIATFNCNSVRQRQDHIIDWLGEHSPDVMALQETKVVDQDFPLGPFEKAGYSVAFRGEKSYNGVAMLTKHEPDSVSFGLEDGDDGESETRLARITYENVEIVNTYIPQGQDLDSPKFQFKLEWFERLEKYVEARIAENGEFVLLGDLNVAPTPIDVYDHKRIWPHVVHCQEVTDAYDALIDLGLVDVFRKHLPQADAFTFWHYRSKTAVAKNRGWRIDHILATQGLADRSDSVFIDVELRKRPKPSDHTVVAATFE